MATPDLVLASASPRRAELLTQMGLPVTTVVTAMDETRLPGEAPVAYVRRLSEGKAKLGFRPGSVSIGSDTIVLIDNEILGKPAGPIEGKAMLARLAGRSHEVVTGVSVYDGRTHATDHVTSTVWFRALDAAEIAAYWDTGEGRDKAGSYGIQGIGGILVERIEGSFSAVMGLPVHETEALLKSLNVDTWDMRKRWLKNSS